ncbi:shufflon protein C' [Salmonella enterica]|uniref:shufflon protein C' n=1 Tax=Salmonella enterica TaxID=28901 RepID=UPI00237F6E1C|nr:shufflon protein C' [Salmonella enterica]
MGSCAAPSAKGDDKFITTDYLQQCQINYSACNWYKSSVAMNHFIGGKSGGSIYYKPIQCPTGYIMTGTRMYGIGDGVDEEHVDAYCCPFN